VREFSRGSLTFDAMDAMDAMDKGPPTA